MGCNDSIYKSIYDKHFPFEFVHPSARPLCHAAPNATWKIAWNMHLIVINSITMYEINGREHDLI